MRAIDDSLMYSLLLVIITTSQASNNERFNGLVITRAVPFAIPHPYQVTVEQIPFPVDHPYEVHVPKPFTVPVAFHRLVPYPFHVPRKSNEEHSTPAPHLAEFQQYDVARAIPQATLPPPPVPNPINAGGSMPSKPPGQMAAIPFQAHRPYAGFNLGGHQFGFTPDPSMIGAYQPMEHINGVDPSDVLDEHNILANFVEGSGFNLNNRLRRRSSSRTSPSTEQKTTSTTTVTPPKKT